MNILIVGNGFDLSHYLPTKYDHFMVAMGAIEGWDEDKGEMGFDDLFGSLYEKENYFFKYTKAMYQTDDIKISVNQIKELKTNLKENVWYQYFSDHVKEIKTWIDFEKKIEEALVLIIYGLSIIEHKYSETGTIDYNAFISGNDKGYSFSQIKFNTLSCLGMFIRNIHYGNYAANAMRKDIRLGNLCENFFVSKDNPLYGFSNEKYFLFINKELEFFIGIFNFYLINIVDNLEILKQIDNKSLNQFDKIYSFNYTHTYLRFYNLDADLDFLHGSCGEKQNIVLGVSDIKNDNLKDKNIYGFVKYHQKLLKNTQYIFLNEYIESKKNIFKKISRCELFLTGTSIESIHGQYKEKELKNLERELILNINITIWGHSLDSSDESYIKEIFSFNDNIDQNFRVLIYYFDHQSKFNLLANLLYILGKDKVEKWMKNKWLRFEKNPNVVEINNIQTSDLIKFYEE